MSNVNEGEKDDFGHNQTSKDEVLNSPGEYFFQKSFFYERCCTFQSLALNFLQTILLIWTKQK